MKIFPLTASDLDAVTLLRPVGWPEITAIHGEYLAKEGCYPRKILVDGQIAGIGTGIVHRGTGWLAHIIVAEAFRHQGLGSSMVSHLITELKNLGCRTLSLVATDLGFPLYVNQGFQVEETYLCLTRGSTTPPPRTSPSLTNYEPRYFPQVASLDREASAEDRRIFLEDKLEGAILFLRGEEVEGFFLPAWGEGLVVAKTAAAGTALLDVKIATGSSRIFLPESNLWGVEHLIQRGFTETSRVRRMVLGERLGWKPRWLYSRIAGNLG